jgi:hypothetical protein
MIDSAELERRKGICRECKDFRTRDRSVVWCHRKAKRPNDGVYCLPWAANEYRKMLMDEKPNGGCPKWHEEMSKPETFPPLPENPQDGVLILSTGSQRRQWLWNAIASVRRHRPDLGIHVLSDVPVDVPFTWVSALTGKASRVYKTQPHRYTPFPGVTMLMDDDAVFHKPLPPFAELLGGNDMALTADSWWPKVSDALASAKTHPGWTSHEDREATRATCHPGDTHHNSGVILFRNTPEVARFFDRWYVEWLRFQKCDQLPLCRTLAAMRPPMTTLPWSYNAITSKWGFDCDPCVFHFTHKHHEGKYHAKYAQPAEPHAAYRAYGQAVNHGQWDRSQYEAVGRLVHSGSPMNLLVWGCGHDSKFWRLVNRGGRTVFVETDPEWAKRARQTGCEVIDWQPPTLRGVPFAGNIPDCPAGGKWNMVIVDGPPGHAHNTPGRELPMRWASAFLGGIGVVHDINRPWERCCAEKYLGVPTFRIPGKNGMLGIWSHEPALIAEQFFV